MGEARGERQRLQHLSLEADPSGKHALFLNTPPLDFRRTHPLCLARTAGCCDGLPSAAEELYHAATFGVAEAAGAITAAGVFGIVGAVPEVLSPCKRETTRAFLRRR
jgi:hypothetical protein